MTAKAPPTKPDKWDDAKKDIWLSQHIPHRIGAARAWLPMEKDWAMKPEPNLDGDETHKWCIGRSVDEGRKVAMRWLIEFVGIARNEKKLPIRPKPYCKGQDVSIADVGGELFDLKHSDARILADTWKGCTQASTHPTTDTTHPPVDPKNLVEALTIVIKHLNEHLYVPKGTTILEAVRKQVGS